MRPHRSLPLAGILLSAAACGGATDGPATAALSAVNGARFAAVYPGDTASWAGFGFGAEQGSGGVLVTTASGLVPAAVTGWRDAEVQAILPDDARSGSTYILTAGDTLGPLDLFVRPRAAYDPAAHAWTADAALPVPLVGAAATALRYPAAGGVGSIVVLHGGMRSDSSLSRETYFGFVAPDGRVTEWLAAPDTVIPPGRWLHGAAGGDRTTAVLDDVEAVAYVLGGIDSADQVLTDALGLGVTSAGAYGLWTSLAPLPERRAGVAAVAALSRLYVIGGFGSDSLATRTVIYATVLPSGTLNGWFRGPELPEGRAFAAAVVVGSTLFVVGGERGLIDPTGVADSSQLAATVYAIRLSPLSGAFRDTTWTELPVTLLRPRSRGAAFVVDDALVVTGGVYMGMPSAGETEFAVLTNGMPGSFQESPGSLLASLAGGPVWLASAPALWNGAGAGRVTLVGGLISGTPTAQGWSQ
jgi:hypothetical protein